MLKLQLLFLLCTVLLYPSNVFSKLTPQERIQLQNPDEFEKTMHLRASSYGESSTLPHKRPLRLGKKTRHNSLRTEIQMRKSIDHNKGEGTYKDLLNQDPDLDPSYMIIDPIVERG